jgi:hypothetical protein
MKRLAVSFAIACAAMFATAGTAAAATWNVWPGHSIQRAIRHASAGDTIIVHRGVYHESLNIRKNRLRLIGRHAVLEPAAHPRGLCNKLDAPQVEGICVFGGVDFSNGNPIGHPRVGVHISGFTVRGFSGDGIFLFHVAGTRITHDRTAHNGGYGIAGFVQHGGAYLWNRSHDNAEPGFYLGDSPHADYVIAHNRAWNNQYGIFIRHSAHGLVHDNRVSGNCVGMFLLDDGERGGLRSMTLWSNTSTANDKACPADEEGAPPLSGIGVLLIGARRTVLERNTITHNVASGQSAVSAGLAMLSAKQFGGLPLRHDRVHNNTITGNTLDVFYDGSGFDNRFHHNTCASSKPAWICS